MKKNNDRFPEVTDEETESTSHGDNIADQCVDDDAYGSDEPLTLKDIYNILDACHTNFMKNDKNNAFLSDWLDELAHLGIF